MSYQHTHIRRQVAAKLVPSIRQAAAEGRAWPGVAAIYSCGHLLVVSDPESYRAPVDDRQYACHLCNPPEADPTEEIEYYTTSGDVRGSCRHRHRTEAAARHCAGRDQRRCNSQGGYSDRRIIAVSADGEWYDVDSPDDD